jgi:RHS repeat-associated protein
MVRDLFFSSAWQVIEERVNMGPGTAQQVWSPVYVDALVERDRDATGGGSLNERLYVQQDANWNVTAVTDATGAVQERYAYDPYGLATVYDASWTLRGPASASQYAWVYLHQGGRYEGLDSTSGLYNFRNRDLSPTLGRWMEEDPIGYAAGDANLYGYVNDRPLGLNDPQGLIKGKGEYKDCNCIGWKEVTVQANVLWGAVNTFATDLRDANQIFEQCCITVKSAGVVKWDKRRTEAIIGRPPIGGILAVWTVQGRPTWDEIALTRNQDPNAGVVYAYYVSQISAKKTTLGYAFSFDVWGKYAPAIVLSDDAFKVRRRGNDVKQNGNVFAHELGHILLNDRGEHVPNSRYKRGYIPGPNLMAESPNIAWQLVEIQCDQMRRNKKLLRWEILLPELRELH